MVQGRAGFCPRPATGGGRDMATPASLSPVCPMVVRACWHLCGGVNTQGTSTLLGCHPLRRLGPPSAFLRSPLGMGRGDLCPDALAGTLGDRTLRLGTPRAQLLTRSWACLGTPTTALVTPHPSPCLPLTPFAGCTGSVIVHRPQGCRYPGAAPFLLAVP